MTPVTLPGQVAPSNAAAAMAAAAAATAAKAGKREANSPEELRAAAEARAKAEAEFAAVYTRVPVQSIPPLEGSVTMGVECTYKKVAVRTKGRGAMALPVYDTDDEGRRSVSIKRGAASIMVGVQFPALMAQKFFDREKILTILSGNLAAPLLVQGMKDKSLLYSDGHIFSFDDIAKHYGTTDVDDLVALMHNVLMSRFAPTTMSDKQMAITSCSQSADVPTLETTAMFSRVALMLATYVEKAQKTLDKVLARDIDVMFAQMFVPGKKAGTKFRSETLGKLGELLDELSTLMTASLKQHESRIASGMLDADQMDKAEHAKSLTFNNLAYVDGVNCRLVEARSQLQQAEAVAAAKAKAKKAKDAANVSVASGFDVDELLGSMDF